MGEVRGFLSYQRADPEKQPVAQRIGHSREFTSRLSDEKLREQGARCMDCGVPFCSKGCPLGNNIPDWNHLASEKNEQLALEALLATNNFPEFTGRVCPAPCESACVLGINEDPVSIEAIEMSLADKGFELGWIRPQIPRTRSGFRVAIVGSGPAGLAAAQQLNRMGHTVVVFERSERAGGLLTFGIPDFKLDKDKVARRIKLLEQEEIVFRCGVNVGRDISLAELREQFDAVLLACGAEKARDLNIAGRDANGVMLAMQFLADANRRLSSPHTSTTENHPAAGKDVVVIGGGDTGSDCIGTARRQGARNIVQFEIMPQPANLTRFPRRNQRPASTPWPHWPLMLRTSSSHEEGCERVFALESVRFETDADGRLNALVTREVCVSKDELGHTRLEPIAGSEKTWPCQLALIAIGFSGVDSDGMISEGMLRLTERGTVQAAEENFMTNVEGVFAAGDVRRGQSLVVWAIAEGRKAANSIESYLRSKDQLRRPCAESSQADARG
ncbi:MAG: hypothetical protein RLZZ488_579 [Pseudomonadota bacterium]|jgi:glutamate synthase (NADPH/NADH) small chain